MYLLDRKDIDAVINAIPSIHSKYSLVTLVAGKDFYSEKQWRGAFLK